MRFQFAALRIVFCVRVSSAFHALQSCPKIADPVFPAEQQHVSLVQRQAALLHKEEASLAFSTTTIPNLADTKAAAATGVTLNAAGDLDALISNIISNVVMIIGCFVIVSMLQSRYPMTFWNNVLNGRAEKLYPGKQPPEGTWSWFTAARKAEVGDIAEMVGLDQAMLMEFCNVAMKILLFYGAPMLLIMGPLNYAFGLNAAGNDTLSYLSMGNVAACYDVDGQTPQTCTPWLYYCHALAVWLVVIAVQSNIHKAMENFLPMRYAWLRKMSKPQCTTLLVTNMTEESLTKALPDAEGLSDRTLMKFFEKVMPGKVESAYVVRDTQTLPQEVEKYKAADAALDTKAGAELDEPTKQKYKDQKLAAKEEIIKLRKVIDDAIKKDGSDVFCANGFVTFKKRVDADIAINLQFCADAEAFLVEAPPETNAVLWQDLRQDPTAQGVRTLLGYGATVALYLGYMPLVIGISQVATSMDLGPLQPLWEGIAPGLGLLLMISFLPTILLLIFRAFFTLKADVWAQSQLQTWYFIFQVVFVLCVTAISTNIQGVMTALVKDPFSVVSIMANSMPAATHFYMNYVVLQWGTHALNLVRYVMLTKFLIAQRLYEDEKAREMAEPEDQDYYGIGSRSARFTINMCIGIIYGTLSPPIPVLTYINFWLCRVIYGYLMPFAESKKEDLGGAFYVNSLHHLFVGNIIYVVLMSGVLYFRADSVVPAAIAASTMGLISFSMKKFRHKYVWEKLPLHEAAVGGEPPKVKDEGVYRQPVLVDPKF